MAGARGLTIGEAAACLAVEYPGVTVAVLRRLESAGKFTAGRSASGYRRYSEADLDLIRLLLSHGPDPREREPGSAGGYPGPDPADLSGAESPLTHPAAGATDAAPGPSRPAALGAQHPAGARTAARAGRAASSRIPAARTSGAGRTQAPAIAALFDVAPDPGVSAHPQSAHPQSAHAPGGHIPPPAPQAPRAARGSRVADLAPREVSQPPEPVGAARTAPAASLRASAVPGQASPAPAPSPAQRRADRRWPDAEFFTPDLGEVSLDRDQLAAAARTDRAWVDGLVEYGLLPSADSAGGADLLVARASAELAQFGVEPRHLRAVAASAARVAELITAATATGTGRDPARRERAVLTAPGRSAEAAAAAVRLHAALLRAALLRG